MGEVIPFKRKPIDDIDGPYLLVTVNGHASMIEISAIDDLAQGRSSIAEYGDCEKLVRLLALALMESLDGPY